MNASIWDPFTRDHAPAVDAGLDAVLPTGSALVARERIGFREPARNINTEVRESVSVAIQSRLPTVLAVPLQAATTWMSGCPHRGQRPLYRRTRLLCTVEAFLGFALCVAAGYLIVDRGWWLLLPVQWLLLVGRTWALFNIFHHATHQTLFDRNRTNRALAFTASLISFSSSLDSYRAEHISSHHTRAMCTYHDKEAAFMPLGFRPGMTVSYYRWRLAWLILTPWTYVLYTRYRLWDWQRSEPLYRQLAVWGFAAALIGSAVLTGTVPQLLWAYVVPLFVVFNITGLLGTFSEHHWGTLLHEPPRLRLVLLQQSRLLLDPAPPPGPRLRTAMAWAKWTARALFYHVPARVAVLPGDSINHDHHHRHPRTENWPESTYERFAHIEGRCPGFDTFPHTHAWSLGEAIDRVFTRMSRAPYDDTQPAPIGEERLFRGLYTTVTGRVLLSALQEGNSDIDGGPTD